MNYKLSEIRLEKTRSRFLRNAHKTRLENRRAMETSLESAEKCTRLGNECAESLSENKRLVQKAQRLYEEMSGMVDAVGMAISHIRNLSERLTSADSTVNSNEERRDKGERVRAFNEKKRSELEEKRRSAEYERQLSETKRETSEQVRVMGYTSFEKRISELEKRLFEIENKKPDALEATLRYLNCENEMPIADGETLEKIILYGHTEADTSHLEAIGDDGFVRITLDEGELSIPVSAPLHSLDGVCDELSVDSSGDVSVIRKIGTVKVTSDISVMSDEISDSRMLYVVPLRAPMAHSDLNVGISSRFQYGANCDTDSVWVSGEYIFFDLDRKEFPDSTALMDSLTHSPLHIAYPLQSVIESAEGSVAPIGTTSTVKYKGSMRAVLIKKENNNENT